MRATDQSDSASRVRMGWPTYRGIVSVFAVLYFASIGPLAWLETNGYGNRVFWQRLNVAYAPIYGLWLHGPDFCGLAIEKYLSNFVPSSPRGAPSVPYIFALPNEVQNERFSRVLDSLLITPIVDNGPITYPTVETRKKREQARWNRIARELAADRSKPKTPWIAMCCIGLALIVLCFASIGLFLKRKSMSTSERAKALYESDLRDQLEATHRDRFVAIEPESEAYFLGDTFIAAALAAKGAFPERKSFVLRIGHDAALHIGSTTS